MDPKLFTKKDLIAWVNNLLSTNIRNIEELSNGAVFCQLVDIIYPSPKFKKINWNAKLQHENLANLKILSTVMMEGGLDKNFDVSRVANKKGMDILQLLQWFRKYFHTHQSSISKEYNAISRRKSCDKAMHGPANHRISIQKQKLVFPKPSPSRKKLPDVDTENQQQLRHCIQINKAIEKVICDQQTKSDLKVEMIKSILFKANFCSQKCQSQKKEAKGLENIPISFQKNKELATQEKSAISPQASSKQQKSSEKMTIIENLQKPEMTRNDDTPKSEGYNFSMSSLGSNCKTFIKLEESQNFNDPQRKILRVEYPQWSAQTNKSSEATQKNFQNSSVKNNQNCS